MARHQHLNPDELRSLLRGDLDWIVMKAIEKDRSRRYETANGLAKDIERHLNQQPVHAAPPTLAYQFAKFARRNRLSIITVSAFVLLLIAGTFLSVSQAVRATRHAGAETRLRKLAESNEFILRHTAYAADMTLTAQALERGDYETARQTLRRHTPKATEPDVRGWEWRHYWYRAQGDSARGIPGHSNTVTGIEFLPGGERFLSCAYDGTVREWEFQSSKEKRKWAATGLRWSAMTLHPSGKMAVAIDANHNTAILVDLISGATNLIQTDFSNNCFAAICSPDGRAYVHGAGGWGFTSTNGSIVVRDSNFISLKALTNSGTRCAFSPDGKMLATGTWINKIKLWSWPELENIGEMGPVGEMGSLDFSPDGRSLASGGALGEFCIWDLQSRNLRFRREAHTRTTLGSVRFSPDGKLIATAGGDQTIVLWNAETLEPVRTLRGYADLVFQVSWSPQGNALLSTTRSSGIRIWDIPRGTPPKVPRMSTRRPLRFSPDSQFMAVESSDPPGAIVLDTKNGQELGRINGNLELHGFLPGNQLLVEEILEKPSRGVLLFCRLPTLERIRELPMAGAPKKSTPFAVISPDGRELAQATDSGEILIWDLATGKLRKSFDAHKPHMETLTYSSDGRWLLTGGHEGEFCLWDTVKYNEAMRYPGDGETSHSVAFSGDSSLVAFGFRNGSYRVVDRTTGGKILRRSIKGEEGRGCLSRDGGSLLATGYHQLRFWNTQTEREAGTLTFGEFSGSHMSLSPDDTVLALVAEQSLLLWRAPTLREIDALSNW